MKTYITPLTDKVSTLPEQMIALSIINGGESDEGEALTNQYEWNDDWQNDNEESDL